MFKKFYIILSISTIIFSSGLTGFSGFVDHDENSLNVLNTYYKSHGNDKLFIKFRPYINTVGESIPQSYPEFGQSMSIFFKFSKEKVICGKTNGAFIPALYPIYMLHSSINLYLNNSYYFGLQFSYRGYNKEYGLNAGIIKFHNLLLPGYVSISGNLLNQSGPSEKGEDSFSHLYSQINYEYGINLNHISIVYSGYYTFNHIIDLQESLARNYLLFKIKLPKFYNKNKKWSINFFIGNSYDTNINSEDENYGKTEMTIIRGVSVTF
ncbi:MAG: hypothetical protein PF551_01670 [Candidatus Marinimicrobia bacterium]|jgi:hypothetical protein|nr:hypothetical protein [Candidatus Neomarinimicrobiota bacterium]